MKMELKAEALNKCDNSYEMAKLISGSQSSLLLPHLQPHATLSGRGLFVNCILTPSATKSRNLQLSSTSLSFSLYNSRFHRGINSMVAPVSSASNLDIEPPREVFNIKPDTTNGDGGDFNGGDDNGGGSGGSGGGGGGNDGSGNKGEEGSDDGNAKKNKALLMSQKLTLAYAALVGLGGLIGYLKSGSWKSLQSGGLAALILLYVYMELPKRPVFASAVGLGLSAALLLVMGSRFKKSGKVFPAGVISLVSFIMTGGYIHGIMKTSH